MRFFLIKCLFRYFHLKQFSHQSTADVVPNAEDGSGDGGKRECCEVHVCKGRSQAAVLHADLDAEGNAFRLLQAQQASYQET